MIQTLRESYFDQSKSCRSSQKIWKEFSQSGYENDTIELYIDCQKLSKKTHTWKPISMEIGQKTLYYIKKDILQGQLSLSFTTMAFTDLEGQKVLSLIKNNNTIDIQVADFEQVKGLLVKKCVQQSFHEDFHIENILANGCKKAVVFQGLRKSNNERVAVKAYSKEFINKFHNGRQSLKNEIKALRKINAKNIIHLQEVHETEHSVYLIMELIEGAYLLTEIMNSILPESNIRQLMYNLIKTLNQIHQQKLILRNISPDNILLNGSQLDFVIIDFGEVQFEGKKSQYQPFRSSGFMAPEILNDQIVDGKCDIFSIGVIFYHLIVQKISKQDYSKTKRIYCDLEAKKFIEAPKVMQSLIKRMLREDPKTRYSAEQCLKHKFFEAIYNPADIGECIKLDHKITSLKIIGCDRENDNSVVEEKSLSGSSISKLSQNELIEKIDQKQYHSKFSKFCKEMQEFVVNSPKYIKKEQEQSLYKQAIKNSYLKREYSKDDNSEDQKLNERRRAQFKKSNSMNA